LGFAVSITVACSSLLRVIPALTACQIIAAFADEKHGDVVEKFHFCLAVLPFLLELPL
jgi:hypothetical protein